MRNQVNNLYKEARLTRLLNEIWSKIFDSMYVQKLLQHMFEQKFVSLVVAPLEGVFHFYVVQKLGFWDKSQSVNRVLY